MSRYRFTPTARRDLKDIKNYIAEQSVPAAFRFVDDVVQKCEALAQFPEMGRLWADLDPPLRSFPVGSYLIFYRPTAGGIQIVRIISGYRDIDTIFQ
jgi:toxin ParE1/3/4